MDKEKLIENIVKLLSKEGFQIVEDNDYRIVMTRGLYSDCHGECGDYENVAIPKDNPLSASVFYETSRSVPGWSYCGTNGNWYSDRDFDDYCPKRNKYLVEVMPDVLAEAVPYGWSVSNAELNKRPPYCLESTIGFNAGSMDRETVKKAIESLDVKMINNGVYLPELYFNPMVSRRCAINTLRAFVKKGFTPVLNFPPTKSCFPSPKSDEFRKITSPLLYPEDAVEVFLTTTGLGKRYSLKDVIEVSKDNRTLRSIRLHLIELALIEAIVNMKPADYDTRVNVIYGLPLWANGKISAMLVGFNKTGSNNLFNRVVYIYTEKDRDGYITVAVGNSLGWFVNDPPSILNIDKTFFKGAVALVGKENKLNSKHWGDKILVSVVKKGSAEIKKFEVRVSTKKFGSTRVMRSRLSKLN